MNDLQIFNNSDFGEIRTTMMNGEPWFVGKDVATALGYRNTTEAVTRHVDPEDKIVGSQNTTSQYDMGSQDIPPPISDRFGRVQYPVWINESGLYCLILTSKLPSARQFKRWITSEVLPALRKTGLYSIQGEKPEGITGGFSFEDYMKAASITSKCTKEHLPLVIYFLEKAGFDIPETMKRAEKLNAKCGTKTNEPPYTVTIVELQEAIQQLRNAGFTFEDMEDIVGINRVLLSYYLHGQRRPKPERCAHIVETINLFLKENMRK